MPGKPRSERPDSVSRNREAHGLNKEYNYFLRVADEDAALLRRYRDVLTQGAAHFAEAYYDYLFAFPASAEVMYRHEREGGNISTLIRKQLQHLFDLFDGTLHSGAAEKLLGVGAMHHRHGIEPAWVLGAYRLFLNHLRVTITTSTHIEDAHRAAVEEAVTKLLFRDMGLMLEGYWRSIGGATQHAGEARSATGSAVDELLANIPQVLWSVDVKDNRVLYASPATAGFCAITTESPIPCLERTVAEDRELVQHAWQRALKGQQSQVESRVQLPGGKSRWFRRKFYPLRDADGRVLRVDGFMEDITEARNSQDRLKQMATSDVLTGLANRTLWYDRLSQAISAARRGKKKVVLMLTDINHFKIINDTLGHPAGDALLRQVGQRLQTALRDTDTLARLGGDEFAVLLPGVLDAMAVGELVAKKINECFKAPFRHDGEDLYLSAAIGIAVYPDHGQDGDTLLSRADIAMYSAKRRDNHVMFYDPGSDVSAAEHLQLSAGLRQALERDEFELVYQPKVDLRSGRICGVEALLRWHHPQRGLVAPDLFIPLAEQVGLITQITDWVLHTALQQCQQWRAAGFDLPVAVNVSARSFQNPRLVDKVSEALRATGLDAACLEIEITENTLMADFDYGSEILARLAELGVGVAIDDFGTGYSSLTYLKRLPIHTLKIDKSFLCDLSGDDSDAAIVRSIIDLGHNLGYRVIAEGVENHAAWELLGVLGCDAVQGFHVSHPLPHDRLSHWVREAPWSAALN